MAQRRGVRRKDPVEARYRDLLEHLPVGVYRTTVSGELIECNRALVEMLGYDSAEELQSVNVLDLYVHKPDRVAHLVLSGERGEHTEFRLRRKDGSILWVRDYSHPVTDETGQIMWSDGIILDITLERRAHEMIRAMALHDPLTGLPNRKLLHDRVSVAILAARRNRRMLALMFLDMDGFKAVNDSLGHAAGDELLVAFSRRLVSALRDSDTVGRMGGDEFTVLIHDIPSEPAIRKIARKVLSEVRKPFEVAGKELKVTASLGVALFPRDGTSADALLKSADAAMYRAKEAGKDRYEQAGE